MNSTQHPPAIVLKKSLIGVVILVIALIVLLILRNIYTSSHIKPIQEGVGQKKSVIASVASVNDTSWYSNRKISSPSRAALATKTPSEPPRLKHALGVSNEAETNDRQALIDAMSAPMSSNQILEKNEMASRESSDDLSHQASSAEHQNGQSEKVRFMTAQQNLRGDVLLQHVQKPLSPFEIKAGSNIPGVLLGGIHSDLPGEISALVRSPVFDSVSGNYVLIPQGAKLNGVYDSEIAYAQNRLLVVWKRIIFPNGDSLNLEGMPGTDLNGYAGFGDEVDNHFGRIFGSVILGSVISAGAQLSQPQNTANSPFTAPTIGQTMAQSLGVNIADTSVAITQKNIAIPPTITIRPGYKFNIKVTKDLVFEAPYED